MSDHALSSLDRYGAFYAASTASPCFVPVKDGIYDEEIGTAATDRTKDPRYLITIHAGLLRGGDLFCSTLLDAFTGLPTTSPKAVIFRLPCPERDPTKVPTTLAQSAIEEIKVMSGLTNEQIAPLAGVSRRSLQAWISGEPISQRKEERLLRLRSALRVLNAGDPVATRQRLMDQKPGSVRLYDLLAAGRFETAIDWALGRRRQLPRLPKVSEREGLVAQLTRLEDGLRLDEAPPTGRFSGRLRR